MTPDPSATLSAIRERAEYAQEYMQGDPMPPSLDDVPRLVAALEAVLALHVEAVIEDVPDPFHYCKTCSGHPAWPCPEVSAITTALTGTPQLSEDEGHG